MPRIGMPDRLDVGRIPGRGEPVGLGAQDDRDRPGEVDIGVRPLGIDAGRHDPQPAARAQASASSAGAAASGTRKMVPALARIAFGLNRSVRGEAATSASAPAPSAERSTAPMLPGFSTPSMTATSGSGGSASRPSERSGIRTTASSPSARSPKASFSKTPSLDGGDRRAAMLQGVERGARVGSGQQRTAHERLDDVRPRIDRPAYLARPVHDRQPLPRRARAGRAGRRPRRPAGWRGS